MWTTATASSRSGMCPGWRVRWSSIRATYSSANIFYPPPRHARVLGEQSRAPGALAIPVYWATRNPYAALNSVVLLAFRPERHIGTYYLVRYLTRDRGAAAIAAIVFAYCPYVFAHTAHIQLLMTAGLPFSLLAFHRLADRPGVGRGATLGAVMAAQAICCGYYGVFDVLLIGFAVVVVAVTRGRWRDREYWAAVLVAAAVSMILVAPAFLPYLNQGAGFRRELGMARGIPRTGATTSPVRRTPTRGCSRTCRVGSKCRFPGSCR